MRKKSKSFARASVILVTLFIFALWALNTTEPDSTHTPLDFYGTSREVSLNEMVKIANELDMSIYLPSDLPKNFELTAIYLKESPFIAIIVYSAENNKDYKTAELVIQISPSEVSPTYNDLSSEANKSQYKAVEEINGWAVILDERANAGGNEEFKAKYGDWTLLARTWIKGMRYNLVAPTLSTEDVTQLVVCMNLVTS